MLTVDFTRLPSLAPGTRVLDLGCGGGRHAFECYRRGAQVVALDRNGDDLAEVRRMFAAMDHAGEAGSAGSTVAGASDEAGPYGNRSSAALAVRADAHRLPFPDAAFDVVIASEVLEHIPDDRGVVRELARVLRPGGTLAVTVPRWWPERVCWALSRAYHETPGGHIRIYRRRHLIDILRSATLVPLASGHAHGLHTPYWWLRCLFGVERTKAVVPRLYHRMLVHDIMRRPRWTRLADRLLNPVAGKSLVLYLRKPEPSR